MESDEILQREAIRKRLAQYTVYGDRGRAEQLVACFTREGALEFEHEWLARGHDEIRQRVFEAGKLLEARVPARALWLRHHVSTQEIECSSATEARVRSYFTAMTCGGPDHVGQYVDQLCLVDGEWLIAHRRVSVEWWSPSTIYVEQAERARARQRWRAHEREVGSQSGPNVRLELRARVAWITLDNPELMNRIEGTMREDLLAALQQAAADPRVRCVAVTGAGATFSAGANVDDMHDVQLRSDAAEVLRRTSLGARVVRTIREMAKPVVAVIDGVAAGAGMNLTMACDLRVGSPRAAFVSSFVRIGLMPDWGGLHFLARRIGMGRAADLMMTGRRVEAARAFELGLLEYLFAPDTFDGDVQRLLEQLAAAPRSVIEAIKRGLDVGAEGGLDAVFAYEAAKQPALFLSSDGLEGVAAFREKRRPRFGD